jgi:hypothetical protein
MASTEENEDSFSFKPSTKWEEIQDFIRIASCAPFRFGGRCRFRNDINLNRLNLVRHGTYKSTKDCVHHFERETTDTVSCAHVLVKKKKQNTKSR